MWSCTSPAVTAQTMQAGKLYNSCVNEDRRTCYSWTILSTAHFKAFIKVIVLHLNIYANKLITSNSIYLKNKNKNGLNRLRTTKTTQPSANKHWTSTILNNKTAKFISNFTWIAIIPNLKLSTSLSVAVTVAHVDTTEATTVLSMAFLLAIPP